MNSTEIALLLNNDSDKINRIGEIIGKKISERDNINSFLIIVIMKFYNFENLNEFEKTFIYIDIFENHTTDGGLKNFFWDSAGQFSHEVLEAYERIGAHKTASIIYDSFLVFKEIPIPKDLELRRSILSNIKPNVWNTLDQEFYDCSDNVVLLIIQFVRENSNHFD